MLRNALPAALLTLLAMPVAGEGLEGRTVLLRVEAWDDPARPLLVSRDYVAVVGPGPEFALGPEAGQALPIPPVAVDLGPDRIDLRYLGQEEGFFDAARFNGFVLTFPADCALFEGAALDPAATSPRIAGARVEVRPQAVRVHVGGLDYGPGDRLGLLLDVTDCVLS